MTKRQLKTVKKMFPKQKRNEHTFSAKDYAALKAKN